ncbi:Hsp33 family molecular chaperone HslO [Syntrophomonas palmitatica]|uniref:Hsp33 family molecular chaperone HslO n=1 Tax=Syntrophomonas palmitatica TaxID=402877 RepID=UPI0009F99D8F
MGMKQPFIGRVPLVSGEIAEDLSQYFYMSEQVLSLVSLGVLVDTDLTILAAGGLLIQAMPGAREDLLAKLENNVLNMGAISEVIKNHKRIEDIAPQVMKGVEYYITGEQNLQFKCNCSRERLAAILAQLSDEELDEIYAAEGKLEVCCNFCNEFYEYTPDDIKIMKK